MQAYIYARFSTLEQGKGSSLARQLADCHALCDRHGWQRSSKREIVDEGRSAYDGANRAKGSELAKFEQEALDGELPADAVLVVERLDRVSRQSAVDVFHFVSRLTDHGVAIATVDGDRVYRKGSFDFASLIELILKAQVSHEESEKKSQRLSAAWAKKRERAASGDKRALTKRCPGWITVDDKTGQYVLIDERAAVVRRIFDMATSGQGKYLIAKTFNLEGLESWGRGSGWHASYIQKILTSKATIGEHQLYRKSGGVRVAEGEPLPNFFPAAIDEATFARAQADREARTSMRGRRGKTISNLFSGLAKCGACGSSMTFRNKGNQGEQYLVCDAALRGLTCEYTMHFNYSFMEKAIIDQTLHLGLTERYFSAPAEVNKMERDLAAQRRILSDLDGRKKRLIDLLSRLDDPEVEQQIRDISSEASTTKDSINVLDSALLGARGALSPKENLHRMRSLLSSMESKDESERAAARASIQQALRSVIQRITCDPKSERVIVDNGDAQFSLDRKGVLQTSAAHSTGLSRLISLREKGWVLRRYKDHPALGSRQRDAEPRGE